MFGNAYFGEGYDLLFGNMGTLIHDQADNVALVPQRRRRTQPTDGAAAAPAAAPTVANTAPPIGAGSYKDFTTAHLENFFSCVRSRQQPVCPFDLGYRVAIACQMAIASYRQGRTVKWDPDTEEIV